MPVVAVDLHVVAAVADDVGHALLGVQGLPQLAEVADLERGALLDHAVPGRDFAEQDAQQRALAHAVVAEQADPVAAHDPAGEVLDQFLAAVAVGDVLGLDDLAARLVRRLDGDLRPVQRRQAVGILLPQGLQAPHPVLVAVPPGLDALADPDFLVVQLLVEELVGRGLVLEHLLLALQVLVVAAGEAQQAAPVEFADARGQLVQEGPVVGDEQHGALPGADAVLEPLDRDDVQVIGGLVEEQQVWLADQRLGEADAPAPAAGQLADGLVGWQHHLGHHQLDPLVDAPAVEFVDAVLQVVEALQAGLVQLLVRQLLVLVSPGPGGPRGRRPRLPARSLPGSPAVPGRACS